MLPLRVVVDTNVVISAALRPYGLQRTVLLLALTKPARMYVMACSQVAHEKAETEDYRR
jgi:predicted nucleic acid-binding protein